MGDFGNVMNFREIAQTISYDHDSAATTSEKNQSKIDLSLSGNLSSITTMFLISRQLRSRESQITVGILARYS